MTRLVAGNASFDAPEAYALKMAVFTAPMLPSKASGGRLMGRERSFLRNLVVANEPLASDQDLESYAAAQMDVLAGQIPGFRKVRESRVDICGVSSPVIESTGMGPDGLALTTITAFTAVDGLAWTISASNLTGERFADTREEYLAIIASFRIEP